MGKATSYHFASEGSDRIGIDFDPGSHSSYIDRYKIYWDTDSGSPYAFNSDTHPGQVEWNGTSAEVSGLTCDGTYYVTVTSLHTYTDPDSGIATEYESLLLPHQLFGDPDHYYPTEVVARTHCLCEPEQEVSNLRLRKDGTEVLFTWDAVSGDPCFDHYVLYGAARPDAWGHFETVADTGGDNSFRGEVNDEYYLVVVLGPNDELGLVGHYSL